MMLSLVFIITGSHPDLVSRSGSVAVTVKVTGSAVSHCQDLAVRSILHADTGDVAWGPHTHG